MYCNAQSSTGTTDKGASNRPHKFRIAVGDSLSAYPVAMHNNVAMILAQQANYVGMCLTQYSEYETGQKY